MPGDTKSSLSLTANRINHNKKYYCIVKNNEGSVESKKATLTVFWLGDVEINPSNITVEVNKEVTFKVNVESSYPPPSSYVWEKNGNPFGNGKSSVSFTPTDSSDGGIISCVVSNGKNPSKEAKADLTVKVIYYKLSINLDVDNLQLFINDTRINLFPYVDKQHPKGKKLRLKAKVRDRSKSLFYVSGWKGSAVSNKDYIDIVMNDDMNMEVIKTRYALTKVKMEPVWVYTEDVMHGDLSVEAIPEWENGKVPPNGVEYRFIHFATPAVYTDESGQPKTHTFKRVDWVVDTYVEVIYNGKTETSNYLIWKDKP
jgi:hypothetical protein